MTITNARAPSTVFIRGSPLHPPRASTDPPGVGSGDLVLCSFATRVDANVWFRAQRASEMVEDKILRPPHRGVRSAQRAQVAPQAVGAATRDQAVDLGMGAPPDRNGAREQCATRGRQLEPAAAFVLGVDHHRDEAAPLLQLERSG